MLNEIDDKIKQIKKARKYLKIKLSTKRNINDYYKIEDEIDTNSITEVIYIVRSKSNYKKYIIKKLYKCKSSYKELYIQKYLKSDKILNIEDIFVDDEYIYMVSKCAKDGDLFSMFNNRSLSYSQALSIVYQISTLIKYIHSMGIIHGDIKMENILLNKYKMYICDFGFSVFASKPKTKIYQYSNPYTAPEQLIYRIFDYKSDVWSLGIILYTLCFDVYPFEFDEDVDYEPDEMYKLIVENKLKFPESCPNNLSELIKGMLEIDLNKRLDLNEVRNQINLI